MGILTTRINHIDSASDTIKSVLNHFAKLKISKKIEKNISSAANFAFSDELLLEKFAMWNQEHEDEIFLFHINRFFEKNEQKHLPASEIDLTKQKEQVEASIKKNVRYQQKKIFGERITKLATKRNLLTNDQLGKFLDISGEQARKFKAGENKPQLATLKNIADRFKTSVEFLIGLSNF